MPREIRHAIDDILEALNRVDQVSQGKTLADFEASWKLQYLVQRAIEIISEASRAIPDDLKALRPEIPWNSVKGIGNVLRHEYSRHIEPTDLAGGDRRVAAPSHCS